MDDLIVGANNANSGGGKSYVVFGKTDNTAVNLSTIASDTGGFVINGTNQSGGSGFFSRDVNCGGFVCLFFFFLFLCFFVFWLVWGLCCVFF
ncbi:Flagellar hook-length control protein FliK [hydrothermal vent metagenome]|uniref:Flagellar hook-length control protein FliK n=1 Tax=hydrothermal vent metagenome TaxID=652676 RepID=A0A1W1E203_9ZZZZ